MQRVHSCEGEVEGIENLCSLLNLSFVVSESDLVRTVTALHEEFFAVLDPAVFERNEGVYA